MLVTPIALEALLGELAGRAPPRAWLHPVSPTPWIRVKSGRGLTGRRSTSRPRRPVRAGRGPANRKSPFARAEVEQPASRGADRGRLFSRSHNRAHVEAEHAGRSGRVWLGRNRGFVLKGAQWRASRASLPSCGRSGVEVVRGCSGWGHAGTQAPLQEGLTGRVAEEIGIQVGGVRLVQVGSRGAGARSGNWGRRNLSVVHPWVCFGASAPGRRIRPCTQPARRCAPAAGSVRETYGAVRGAAWSGRDPSFPRGPRPGPAERPDQLRPGGVRCGAVVGPRLRSAPRPVFPAVRCVRHRRRLRCVVDAAVPVPAARAAMASTLIVFETGCRGDYLTPAKWSHPVRAPEEY